MTTSTIRVTGISGFIAKHCALELLANGYRVRGTVRSLAKFDAVRKTLAERAARDFVAGDGDGDGDGGSLHFSTVNPGLVLEPVFDADIGSSADLIASCLRGKHPGCPRLSFAVVDVRDVAKAHRLALETAEPSGGRYLGVEVPVDNAATRKALGIKFIGIEESAPAMAESLLRPGLV